MNTGNELQIKSELDEEKGKVVYKPNGDLLASNSDPLRTAIMESIHSKQREIVLDLADVRFIDSTGLGMLMGLKSTCSSRKIAFALTNVSPAVGDILRLTRIDRFFTFI